VLLLLQVTFAADEQQLAGMLGVARLAGYTKTNALQQCHAHHNPDTDNSQQATQHAGRSDEQTSGRHMGPLTMARQHK
jgi:hypothetical protein